MDLRKFRMLLFGFGAVLGGVLAILLWRNYSRLGGWAIAPYCWRFGSRWGRFPFTCCGGRIDEDNLLTVGFLQLGKAC